MTLEFLFYTKSRFKDCFLVYGVVEYKIGNGGINMQKLPYGISDYERIKEQNYYYVDKTKYIEKIENISEPYIMFLRPRKFGKTLFTSMLENYYDIKKKGKFKKLYEGTYIGNNPTKLRNSYNILKFNFSGIDTQNADTTIRSFKNKTIESIKLFISKYNLDFYINETQEAEEILNSLFTAFNIQKENEKIYVIIDEYDHFANELLGFNTNQFKTLVSKNGKVRKWYEVLKQGTETIVDRIFITGVAPITQDSLTSGFNIGKDITKDARFNEMIGFTKEELLTLMNYQNINKKEILLPIMKENYDGYKFSVDGKEKIYNSNMCLYFLNEYEAIGKVPKNIIDVNIASDYSKLGKMLELCKGEGRQEIIEKTVIGEKIVSQITEKFNPEIEFTQKDLVSMLYYLGYLTIEGEDFAMTELKVPNKVMKEMYAQYFTKILANATNFTINEDKYNKIAKEIALEGKLDTIIQLVKNYLTNLSNRDYIQFNEKYIKLIFYCILMNIGIFNIKSEMEINRKYPDLLIIPKEKQKGYASIIIEFKYLKKGEENKLKDKKLEAKKQIEEYVSCEDIKQIERLYKYTVVAINDNVYVERVN